jgi:hypothetical protein
MRVRQDSNYSLHLAKANQNVADNFCSGTNVIDIVSKSKELLIIFSTMEKSSVDVFKMS